MHERLCGYINIIECHSAVIKKLSETVFDQLSKNVAEKHSKTLKQVLLKHV